MKGAEGTATPLFFVLKPGTIRSDEDEAKNLGEKSDWDAGGNAEDSEYPNLDDSTKTEIVRLVCDQNTKGQGRTDPVNSLACLASLPKDDCSKARNAVHAAIETNFPIPEDIVARLSKITVDFEAEGTEEWEEMPCLEVPDSRGRTCLHIALTAPFTPIKFAWAKQLAKMQPSLLKLTYKHSSKRDSERNGAPTSVCLTPLQYFSEQRKVTTTDQVESNQESNLSNISQPNECEFDAIEEFLKCRCLESFDINTCKAIMYTRENVREIFLTLDDETISSEFLESQRKHYKLDTSLKSVHITNSNRFIWNDKIDWDENTHKNIRSWHCMGNTDLFMVFHWLKDIVMVKKVFEVVVDDFSVPHSDKAIIECLKELNVETWDWRRMDIPVDVITEAAGEHVRSLYLYCSGLNAVLQSWSDSKGLVNLKHLERVEIELHQGLESQQSVRNAADKFKEDMESIHAKQYEDDILKGRKKKIEVICNPLYTASKKSSTHNEAASQVKSDGESGFEEQDWLKCMDEFAGLIENIETVQNSEDLNGRPIKVALIDDGVKTSYAWLDENINCGRSGWESSTTGGGDKKKPATSYPRNYNSSQTGHGTVMAYYIRRVCPWVKLCIAKLDCQVSRPRHGAGTIASQEITFSIESITEAIKWAITEEVDIISMSWAIDKVNDHLNDRRVNQLRDAITQASDNGILLFCANPDKGVDYIENETYPKALVPEKTLFCIGAATQDGKRWSRISVNDDSCDFFPPGVELGIPVENTTKKSQEDPPPEWRRNSGSSLSCALAAGLAAMVLHCTLVSGYSSKDPRWEWLKTRTGMSVALRNISVEQRDKRGLWLPVRRVFGEAVKSLGGSPTQMLTALQNEVVTKLLMGAPIAPSH